MKRMLAIAVLLLPFGAQSLEGCWVEPQPFVSFPETNIEHRQATAYGHLDVYCEAGMPYQVEVANAERGGVLHLSAGGATTIPVRVLQSSSRMPWGRSDQGEAMGGVGTGERAPHAFEVEVRLEALPEPGAYRGRMEINLEF